jgi:hypothetical protein
MRTLVQIEIADGPARVGRLFGFLYRLLKLFIQQFGSMFLRFHRLTENRFAPAVLFFHGPGGFFHVVEHSGLYRGGVGNNSGGCGIDLQQRAAARTGNFDGRGSLRHFANHTAKACLKGRVPCNW